MISSHKAALCRGAREIHHPVIEKALKHASFDDNCVMMNASLPAPADIERHLGKVNPEDGAASSDPT